MIETLLPWLLLVASVTLLGQCLSHMKTLKNYRVLLDRYEALSDKYLMLADVQGTRESNRKVSGPKVEVPQMAAVLRGMQTGTDAKPVEKVPERKLSRRAARVRKQKNQESLGDRSVSVTFPGGPPAEVQKEKQS